MKDFATGKEVRNGPEESVRQELERILVEDYDYRKKQIDIEVPIPRGSSRSNFADIVVYRNATEREPTKDIIGIVETKAPKETDGIEQLKSYMTATSAEWGVWTNGDTIKYFCKPQGESRVYDNRLNNIPVRGQSIEDVGNISKRDLKPYGRTELKIIFRRIMNTLYANSNMSRPENLGNETIKLIFAKIRDETSFRDRPPAFRVGYGEGARDVKRRIVDLFKDVVEELYEDGVFGRNDSIALDAKSVAWVVGQLERGSLTKTPSDVVGDAFEVFAGSKFAGDKGQFFTPRGIIEIATKLLDPMPKETICDPACGSGGFLITAMRHVWEKMENSSEWKNQSPEQFNKAKERMAERYFYGIDKELDLVRIAKAYMAISGDGRSNIVHQNSLDSIDNFSDLARQKFTEDGRLRQFDCILTNPPYGTKAKVSIDEARNYDLGHAWKKSADEWSKGRARKTDPYILFIERCFEMLKFNGRMAIVLPETVFHAPTTAYLRDWIKDRGAIIAVVDLPHNSFRPHCNAKTCLLVIQKGIKQGNVIMATPEEMGHNHNGNILYRRGTDEIWDDLPIVVQELDNPTNNGNKFVFEVSWSDIEKADNFVPNYYKKEEEVIYRQIPPNNRHWVKLEELEESKTIYAWKGHGSPNSSEKGQGKVPYIRVADIVNWELYRNPTSGVTRDVYENMTHGKREVLEEDIIFVQRGSYRIGTVAMASPRDTGNVVLTRELLTFRVNQDNELGITSYYLLAMLSSDVVQKQIHNLVFTDTTLPNIGDRWRELRLLMHLTLEDRIEIGNRVKLIIQSKWNAQKETDALRDQIGDLTT